MSAFAKTVNLWVRMYDATLIPPFANLPSQDRSPNASPEM